MSTPWGFDAPVDGDPRDSAELAVGDALARMNSGKVRYLSQLQADITGGTPIGAEVNTMLADLQTAGGGTLIGDVSGTGILEEKLQVPRNVQLWIPNQYAFIWQAQAASALACMIEFAGTGNENAVCHFPGQLDGNNTAVDGIHALRYSSTFMVPRIFNCTGAGFVAANGRQTVHAPILVACAYGVKLDGGALGPGGGQNAAAFHMYGGDLGGTTADVIVAPDSPSTLMNGIAFNGVSFTSAAMGVHLPADAHVSEFDLTDCRGEGITGATARFLLNEDTNSGCIRIKGGGWASASSGTQPTHLFEMEGFGNVVENIRASNYTTAVVKGLAGMRTATMGGGCVYDFTKPFLDDTLITNKERITRWQRYGNEQGLLVGRGSDGHPALGTSLYPTVGTYYGTGTPEGARVAGIGSIYHRIDGGASTSFYVKESGTGNTGWVAK